MRDYGIRTDRLINQLTPHYLGGRKFVLFLQSLVAPLQSVSITRWEPWSHDIYQECAATSQVFFFEYFLNQRFAKYFQDPNAKIKILDTDIKGVIMYWKSVRAKRTHMPMRMKSEQSKKTPCFYGKNEKQQYTGISFIIQCPKIKISQADMTKMISFYADRYHITGKRYIIQYN